MDTFEDENPFEDTSHLPSEASSTSKVALYEPPSGQLSPSSPTSQTRPFPSPGTHKVQQSNYKTEFCCGTDRVLHSGDDVEILVRHSAIVLGTLPDGPPDNGRAEDIS
jgi:sorting nexin-4